MIPRMFGSGLYQMSVIVDTFCASLATIVGAGVIAAVTVIGFVLKKA